MKHLSKHASRRGSALVMVSILLSGMAMGTLVMLMTIGSSKREQTASQVKTESTFAAEAALNLSLLDLSSGGTGVLGANQQEAFGGADLVVTATDLGNNLTSLTATAQLGESTSVVEAVVRESVVSIWAYGAFGDESMTMDSNSMVDSYDSTLGTYASQEVNGNGNSTYASAGGNVGSNGSITIKQNSTIHGNATPGPGSSTTILGNASVSGSTAPASDTVTMPPLTRPALTFSGPMSVSGGSTVTLPPGDHAFDTLDVGTGATLLVTGPATILVGSAELSSNSQMLVDAANGPVTLYVIDDFVLNSNTLMASTTLRPADLSVQLESDNIIDPNLIVDLDDVLLESNAQLYGSIYAPNALIDIDSNFELFGAVVARELHLDSNSKVHFDESLANATSQNSTTLSVVYSRVLR